MYTYNEEGLWVQHGDMTMWRSLTSRHVCAKSREVDKAPHKAPLQVWPVAAGAGGGHHQIVSSTVPPQEHLEGRQHCDKETAAALLG